MTVLPVATTTIRPEGEDGYELWLRYRPLPAGSRPADLPALVPPATETPTLQAAREEMSRGLAAMLGVAPVLLSEPVPGAILLGTPATAPVIARLDLPLAALGSEGYLIRSLVAEGAPVTVVAANSDVGVLYGAFALLRHLQTGGRLDGIDLASAPAVDRRILNHWDNLDRTIERGYSGFSIWDWWTLPDHVRPIYHDYARANASVGINGSVLNNVNASPDMLLPSYLEKAAKLAEVFRIYGIRTYLSVNFATPSALGEVSTADPLDPEVRRWWQDKAAEIHRLIPDFGGFLVKANSEGEPGPQDYGRDHADGANMLAEALAPHGGLVIWRAFVYSPDGDTDRAAEALNEFAPLDGRFRDNVIVQVKNGPIDFQPMEPFSALFGAMPRTPLALEVQITKEYLGQATHLAWLGPVFEEVLSADTGPAGTIAEIITRRPHPAAVTAIAGVANIGTDRDWTGGVFNQANWYTFGRQAWDTGIPAAMVAEEWVRMTFTQDAGAVAEIADMMRISRNAVVNYMAPLGLAHQIATSHHYGPGPWVDDLGRPDWNPVYYARADRDGIGFDRTATGSRSIDQYSPEARAHFDDPATIDEDLLLWFHHLPWDYRTRSGRPLWDELVARYDLGVAQVAGMVAAWAGLRPHIDAMRHEQVGSFLAIQHREAQWWRDACIAFFSKMSGRPVPEGHAAPPRPLEEYIAFRALRAPGI